jgi:hypothetical protein
VRDKADFGVERRLLMWRNRGYCREHKADDGKETRLTMRKIKADDGVKTS